MRKLLILTVLLVIAALSFAACKAELDKTKLAGLLVGFVVDYATGQELDLSALDDLAIELSLQFVDAYSDEIPARYREETVAFANGMIPKLIRDYGLSGLGAGDDDEEQMIADMTKIVLLEFDQFHEDYAR